MMYKVDDRLIGRADSGPWKGVEVKVVSVDPLQVDRLDGSETGINVQSAEQLAELFQKRRKKR